MYHYPTKLHNPATLPTHIHIHQLLERHYTSLACVSTITRKWNRFTNALQDVLGSIRPFAPSFAGSAPSIVFPRFRRREIVSRGRRPLFAHCSACLDDFCGGGSVTVEKCIVEGPGEGRVRSALRSSPELGASVQSRSPQ